MEKTRELFKIIADTKRIFPARMVSIKRTEMVRDLREAEEIEKRWQEYTKELHKKKKTS